MQTVPEELRQGAHFLPEIADDAAATELVACHAGLRVGNEVPYALEWGRTLIEQPAVELAREIGCVRLDQFGAEDVLAREVVVE